MDDEQFDKVANALSDRNRINIIKQISISKYVFCNELEANNTLSQPTVSHHVKILVDSKILFSEKEGKYVKLSLNNDVLKNFIQRLESFTH